VCDSEMDSRDAASTNSVISEGAGLATPENALLTAMSRSLPGAIEEISRGRKEEQSHWSRYAFPTSLRGRNDPRGASVRPEYAAAVAAAAPAEWRSVLEMLSQDAGLCSLPTRDVGRVTAFVDFWDGIAGRPAWMGPSCTALRDRLKERASMSCVR